jgi:galactonate dehydratase
VTCPLTRMAVAMARVSHQTRWIFFEIERADGRVGVGEASLDRREDAVLECASRIAPLLWTLETADPGALASSIHPLSLEDAAAVSAIDMALWDLHAQDKDAPLVTVLGGAQRTSVASYANINRRTRDRSAAGFARSARDALESGFSALKIAPFDEVTPALCARGEGSAAMRSGLARIAAVREAGPSTRLMVDCHWRFDEATAATMIDAAAEHAVHWIECPLSEGVENIPALGRLRRRARSRGILLAGMEQGVGYPSFRPFCEAQCYDVMMPDVKYVGGLREMLRCAEAFAQHGIEMSPHNPSGPVAHAASLHVSAAMRSFDMLELQFDESPLFNTLVPGIFPRAHDGIFDLPPSNGLGVRLDHAVLAACIDGQPRIFHAP